MVHLWPISFKIKIVKRKKKKKKEFLHGFVTILITLYQFNTLQEVLFKFNKRGNAAFWPEVKINNNYLSLSRFAITIWGTFVEDFQNTIPTKLGSNPPSSQEKVCFVYCSITHKNSVLRPCYFYDQNEKMVFCRWYSKHHFCRGENVLYLGEFETRL